MGKISLRLLAIAVAFHVATCQTFQYSRGWTNGKRGDDVALPIPTLKLTDLPIHNFELHTEETLSTLCCKVGCATEKIVLMLKIKGKSQLYLVPCDLLHAQRRNMNEEKVQDNPPVDGLFRRSLSPEYDSNNDNY